MNMALCTPQTFNQVLSVPAPPTHGGNASLSSLAAGEARMITAKTYRGDIESLLKSALVQGLWNDEKKRGVIFSTNFDKTIAAVVQRIDDNAKREVETSSINADWVMAGRSSIIYGLLV